MLFEEDNFICRSKADNMICIHLSLDVLLKAMRSASAHDAGTLDIALRHRPLKTSQNGAAVPLLELQWRNDCISISQEIPIEKPCSAVEVERIHGLCLGGATCGFYADIQPEAKSFMVSVYPLRGHSSVPLTFAMFESAGYFRKHQEFHQEGCCAHHNGRRFSYCFGGRIIQGWSSIPIIRCLFDRWITDTKRKKYSVRCHLTENEK